MDAWPDAKRVICEAIMSEPGFQSKGQANKGITYIVMLKSRLVGDRFCQPGDVLEVYESVTNPPSHFRHSEKRLHRDHAQKLIAGGAAETYSPKAGEKIASTDGETAALEVATDPGPLKAERAVTNRQKAGAI